MLTKNQVLEAVRKLLLYILDDRMNIARGHCPMHSNWGKVTYFYDLNYKGRLGELQLLL